MNRSNTHLMIDFSHRLSYTSPATPNGLFNSITLMSDRATGVLYLLQAQAEDEGNDFMVNSLASVICDLKDIKMLSKAFADYRVGEQ